MDDGTTKRLRSSKAERLFRKQRGAGSIPVGASNIIGVWDAEPQDRESRNVDFEYRPVLYQPDGRALVRRAGF